MNKNLLIKFDNKYNFKFKILRNSSFKFPMKMLIPNEINIIDDKL